MLWRKKNQIDEKLKFQYCSKINGVFKLYVKKIKSIKRYFLFMQALHINVKKLCVEKFCT